MEKYVNILKKYWGYDSFRPLQDQIVKSIGENKDTLALMPTGGGKSITFQVPAMAKDGLCIVVTPLIALMKDQVAHLRKRKIKAACIYTGMTKREILTVLDNCILDEDYKFLYVSPERLESELFITKVKQMNICQIAVDESHCISQWGYDFRPSYLRIAKIRDIHPNAPIIALTATATKRVVEDIQEKLKFKNKNCIRKSFERKNLYYVVRNTEDKETYLLKILHNQPGCAIVYVRNRKKTKETADFLIANNITACHYHAGLSNEIKDKHFNLWFEGKCRVMVATNAFGMGIDKADVRIVVHLDLPDNLESYFQEAGRAGRDEKKAYAVMLYNKTDARKLKKRISDNFPEKDFIRKVYDKLGNYFELAVGSGLNVTFDFNFGDFCQKFALPIFPTYSALNILTQAEYIDFQEDVTKQSRIVFAVEKEELHLLSGATKIQSQLIEMLLRSYTGLFTDSVIIDEELLAKRLGIDKKEVCENLIQLSRERLINYIPHKQTPQITYTCFRVAMNNINIPKAVYENRKSLFEERINSILEYAKSENICRSRILLNYFDENLGNDCGHCDICIEKKKKANNLNSIEQAILNLLKQNALDITEIKARIKIKDELITQAIRLMSDKGLIQMNKEMKFEIK